MLTDPLRSMLETNFCMHILKAHFWLTGGVASHIFCESEFEIRIAFFKTDAIHMWLPGIPVCECSIGLYDEILIVL